MECVSYRERIPLSRLVTSSPSGTLNHLIVKRRVNLFFSSFAGLSLFAVFMNNPKLPVGDATIMNLKPYESILKESKRFIRTY